MPTEQEAKPAVVTPSLQQWRSPSTFRGAPGEDPLKWLKMVCQQEEDSFKNGLSGLFGDRQKIFKMPSPVFRQYKSYIQGVFLPRGSDERRRKKVSHLMKGVAEDIYQALLTREINDTASFIKWCNYIEDMKQKRVGRPKFERLPNVVPVLTDEIFGLSYSHNRTRRSPSKLTRRRIFGLRSPILRRDRSDEVERVLAPVSTKPTETDHDQHTPLKAVLTTLETADFDDVGTEEEIRRPNFLAVLRQVPREADPQYVVTDPRRHIADPQSPGQDLLKGFCYLAEPLQSLLKSGVEFHWGPEEVEAFHSLKKAHFGSSIGDVRKRASSEIHTDASGCTWAFGDGPRSLEPWSSDVDDTCELAPPLLTTTPTGGRLSSRQI
ncbi:retrotrans_gag domain-containing protein [Trichonephila clavipes]|nr:retrotrans_gag domain-containing protein [Trichonephila clavipes]